MTLSKFIDRIPIPVCKLSRAYFSKCFKDIASYGYCASKEETYFCLKLHALVTTDGFISDFFLIYAGVDDKSVVLN
ncbi:transposase [Clostridium neonatale]|uniref:transposase n=1 Tax=Clostridium neonatale TaxID=137838 RepID=UPI00338D7756